MILIAVLNLIPEQFSCIRTENKTNLDQISCESIYVPVDL